MSKGGTDVTTTRIDPDSQRFLDQFRARALQNQSREVVGPNLRQFIEQSQGLLGNLDFAQGQGLEGIEGFLDPNLNPQLAAIRAEAERQRTGAQQRAGDVTTQSGALGGSRGAVLEAELTRDVNQNEAGLLAGTQGRAFDSAANRLIAARQQAARLGFGGLNNLFGASQFQEGAANNRLGILGQAIGPTGSDVSIPTSSNPFAGALGGAASGAAIGGPFGAVGGGILGGLGALF